MTKREKAVVVDDNDNIVSIKWRDELLHGDRFRIVGVWITNSSDEILLAQRAFSKSTHPGLWGPAAAGGVEPNETYEQAAYKELAEEIGLQNTPLTHIFTTKYDYKDGGKRYSSWFSGTCDKQASEFSLESEVEAVKWVTREWLETDLDLSPTNYVPSFRNFMKLFSNK